MLITIELDKATVVIPSEVTTELTVDIDTTTCVSHSLHNCPEAGCVTVLIVDVTGDAITVWTCSVVLIIVEVSKPEVKIVVSTDSVVTTNVEHLSHTIIVGTGLGEPGVVNTLGDKMVISAVYVVSNGWITVIVLPEETIVTEVYPVEVTRVVVGTTETGIVVTPPDGSEEMIAVYVVSHGSVIVTVFPFKTVVTVVDPADVNVVV